VKEALEVQKGLGKMIISDFFYIKIKGRRMIEILKLL
jgi:hypothetical protein